MHSNKRNFINLSEIKKKELEKIFKRARQLKNSRYKDNSFKKSLLRGLVDFNICTNTFK